MANDLIRWDDPGAHATVLDDETDWTAAPRRSGPTAGRGESHTEEDEEWDLPPSWQISDLTRQDPTPDKDGVEQSRKQADDARKVGDEGYAQVRETDTAEKEQSRWDWGDLRTWAIIWGMFFGFLAFVAIVYFMPEGRNASPPTIRVY